MLHHWFMQLRDTMQTWWRTVTTIPPETAESSRLRLDTHTFAPEATVGDVLAWLAPARRGLPQRTMFISNVWRETHAPSGDVIREPLFFWQGSVTAWEAEGATDALATLTPTIGPWAANMMIFYPRDEDDDGGTPLPSAPPLPLERVGGAS